MLARHLSAHAFRSLECFEVELGSRVTMVIGPNGAGKTNVLEALWFALSGRSFRTADRRELIPFGAALARVEVTLDAHDGSTRTMLASVSRSEGRRHLLDGSPVERCGADHRPHLIVFSPDRLVLIKGPPGERRAHVDALAAALWPARADLRRLYGQALAQRNALLGRVAAGLAPESELDAWDAALAAAAAPLIEVRAEVVAATTTAFTAFASELGLQGEAELRYAPRALGGEDEIRAGLGERRATDLRLGRATWGPHLDEIEIRHERRSLRRFGSQGQQRLALLAFLFAEREALLAHGETPLMLLDDVMSELDEARRDRLADRLAEGGQALLTATDSSQVPGAAGERTIRMPDGAGAPVALVA